MAVLSVPTLAFATAANIQAALQALQPVLGALVVGFWAPWLFLIGYGLWWLFGGKGD
jgi:hypothetical protein